MMPVNGVPFVYRLFKKIGKCRLFKDYLFTSLSSSTIIDQINNDKPVNCDLIFVVEEEPLGTGVPKIGIRFCRRDKFLVLNGDTYSSLKLSTFLSEMQNMISALQHYVLIMRNDMVQFQWTIIKH